MLVVCNVAMAKYHSQLMREGGKIQHGWWGLAYVVVTIGAALISKEWLLIPISFLLRKVVFDCSLNKFNNRKLFFVSTETTSIIDKIHFKIFGYKSWIYYSLYLLISIVLTILI